MSEGARDVFAAVVDAGRGYLMEAARAAAHRLGAFAALERPATAGELAAALGVAPRRLRALLDVLALDGTLLAERGGETRYRRGAVAPAPALPPGDWGRLAEVIRDDRPLEDGGPAACERFHRHLWEAGAAAAAEVAARFAGDLGDGALLDVGAGLGTYAAALLRAAPSSRATLVDRPEVVVMARAALAPWGERVCFREGDARTTRLGEGFRLALLCNLLHLHPPEDCRLLALRVAAALAPGGLLLVKDLAIAEDRSGPPAGVLFALNMALYTEGGDVHPPSAIAGWLRAAGLHEVERVALAGAPDGVLLVGRKLTNPRAT